MRTSRLDSNKLFDRLEKYCIRHAYYVSMTSNIDSMNNQLEITVSGMGFNLVFKIYDRYNFNPRGVLIKTPFTVVTLQEEYIKSNDALIDTILYYVTDSIRRINLGSRVNLSYC
jgi:hypothetical protein